jgi:hypothetical protein
MRQHSSGLSARQTLELFVERVDELSRMRILRSSGLSSEWLMSFGVNQPTVFRSVEPDEEDLRSYLMAFRKFISPKEPVFIRSVHGLCHKHFTSDEMKRHILDCQNGWKQHVKRSNISLKMDGRDIQPEHIADLWINGHYFHDDLNKAAELRRLVAPSFLFVRQEFLNFIVEATRVIGASGFTVKMALRDGSVNC